MTDWATVSDVETYTGASVTPAEVTRAQALVEIFANTTSSATDQSLIESRNVRLLRQAVSYQAAWMAEHPDVFTHVDASNWSQDGVSGAPSHANAGLLAPLAKRCIDRLTWMTAPLRVRRRRRGYDNLNGNRDSAAYDDNRHDWRQL